jgi:prepilin-type N-terminal cleavage/methylation domain-containing protein
MFKKAGFTIVELLVVITVIAILAGIVVVAYGAWQKRAATQTVLSDTNLAKSGLENFQNFKDTYPPNLAGTGFVSSKSVAITLYTNAPSIGVYDSLTDDQNAQLFLNVCNANLNGTNNTTCTFNGSGSGAKIHVKGTSGSNFYWSPSPLTKTYIQNNCASLCTKVATLISQFEAQGGVFPIVLSGNNVSLPEPTNTPSGNATEYCLEARSGLFQDVIYHTLSSQVASSATAGACPPDPDLQYFP